MFILHSFWRNISRFFFISLSKLLSCMYCLLLFALYFPNVSPNELVTSINGHNSHCALLLIGFWMTIHTETIIMLIMKIEILQLLQSNLTPFLSFHLSGESRWSGIALSRLAIESCASVAVIGDRLRERSYWRGLAFEQITPYPSSLLHV